MQKFHIPIHLLWKRENAVRAASAKFVRESDIFDLNGHGYIKKICTTRSPCPALVFLYAKMGLHRYNFVQGTKFEMISVNKYVKSSGGAAARSYYTTFDAIDPSGDVQTFETRVEEQNFRVFFLTCHISKIRGGTRDGEGYTWIKDRTLPECPKENPFEIYYHVNESELKENEDWIRLYVELAVVTTDRERKATDLGFPTLEIVDVAVDAYDDNEGKGRLDANNAVFYIRYKDSYVAKLAEDLDRIAIVRRSFDKTTGCFCLIGQNQSSDVISKKGMIEGLVLY